MLNKTNTKIDPFPKKDYLLQTREFPLGAIIHTLGLNKEKTEYKKPKLNWNPWILDSGGNRQFYQRPFVWTLRDNQNLIESIYNEIDCGKIICRANDINLVLKSDDMAFYDIVDGKQRLNAVRRLGQAFTTLFILKKERKYLYVSLILEVIALILIWF